MKLSVIICIAALSIGVVSAQDKTAADMPKDKETKKFIEMLAGSWKLQQIVDEAQGNKGTANQPQSTSKDTKNSPVTDTDQSRNAMQMLEFEPDARYKVNNSTSAIDSGSYRVNEQHGILYMESDADDITPTEWKITINKEQLTLVGREDADSRYKYVYRKEKDKVGTN